MRDDGPAILVAVESLGCKLNQAEVASWARDLQRAGYRLVDSPEKAQVYILNTCTLTHVADRKSRHLLRMARRGNPGALIVAAGCYAERAAGEIAQLDEVDLVLGNTDKARLVQLIHEKRNICGCHTEPSTHVILSGGTKPTGHGDRRGSREESVPAHGRLREEPGDPSSASGGLRMTNKQGAASRARALVKVQDGCDEFCTYCVVPLVRGRQRSRPVADVLNDVGERVAEGYQEIVLTGTQIGAYGRDSADNEDLCRLVRRILAETPVARLRLTSIHPHDLSGHLLGLWRDERLCRQLHLSLQSGSDSVLRRMGRPYTTAAFARAVYKAREMIPDVAITTDVIVGFPGESDAEFEESRLFCEKMGFARMHVFVYSARPATAAATMRGHVPDKIKKQRSQTMLALAEDAGRRFREGFLGRELAVLWEAPDFGEAPERMWSGLTGNYVKIYTQTRGDLSNRLLEAKLVRTCRDGLWGELVKSC